jgi:hypothetical protein
VVDVVSISHRIRRGGLAAAAVVLLLTVAASPSMAAVGRDLNWTRLQPSSMANSIVRDITSNAGVLVAVGQVELTAGIWRSRDARHWTRVDAGDAGESTVLQAVTPWRQGFAAVGLRYTFTTTGIQRDAVVMTSPDGRHWRRADLPGGHGALPNAVAVHRGVLVAGGCVGVERFGCLFAAEGRAVLWTSPDAHAWTKRMLPDGEHSFVNAIASAGEDLVLVGSEVSVEVQDGFAISSPIATAVWEGPTSATVRRLRDDSLDSGRGNGVVAYRGTYLAVGSRGGCVESWAREANGWTTVDPLSALCDEEISDAIAFHGAVYATGFRYDYERLPVWLTRDLRHWTAVLDDAFTSGSLMFEGSAILEWHGRLLIAGTVFSDGPPAGAIWLGTPGA